MTKNNLNDLCLPTNIFPANYFNQLADTLNPSKMVTEVINQSIKKFHENLGQAMINLLSEQLKMIDFTQVLIQPYVNADIIEDEARKPTIALPHVSKKTKMGIIMTNIGTFKFRRKTLSKISMKNAEGRVLALFMNNNLFASDERICGVLKIDDYRSFGFVLRNIKNKFKNNGLKITMERIKNPDGYFIHGIEYIQ